MNCEQFREKIAADPSNLDEECAAHAFDCAPCAAFGARARNAEWLIQEALRFDVDALKTHVDKKRTSVAAPRRFAWAGVAAVLVAGFAVWLNLDRGPAVDAELLVAEVLEHWHHEPESWVDTDVRVSPASLEEVVSGSADVDANLLGLVSYARSCFVRDRWVPHLVVQGQEGPVMLLLLPHEQIAEPLPLDMPQEGLRGVILPVGDGSIAVLGEDGESMDPLADRINSAVEWSI